MSYHPRRISIPSIHHPQSQRQVKSPDIHARQNRPILHGHDPVALIALPHVSQVRLFSAYEGHGRGDAVGAGAVAVDEAVLAELVQDLDEGLLEE